LVLNVINWRTIVPRRKLLCPVAHITNNIFQAQHYCPVTSALCTRCASFACANSSKAREKVDGAGIRFHIGKPHIRRSARSTFSRSISASVVVKPSTALATNTLRDQNINETLRLPIVSPNSNPGLVEERESRSRLALKNT